MTNSTRSENSAGTLRSVIQIIGAKAATLAFALAVQVVLARALGPDGRGTYEAALLWGALTMILFNPGVETSSLYFVSSGRVRLPDGISSALAITITSLAMALGLTAICLQWQPSFMSGFLAKARPLDLAMGTLAGATALAAQTALSMTTAEQRFGAYSSAQVLHRCLVLALTSIILVALGSGASGAITSIVIADLALVSAALYWLGRGRSPAIVRPTWNTVSNLVGYGGRFYLGKIGNQFNFRLGPLVLAACASPAELGLYGQASAIAIQYMSLPDAIYTVLLPKMARSPDQAAAQAMRTGRLLLAVGAISVVVSLLVARPVFVALFSETFLPSVPLFQIIIGAFVLRSIGKVYEPYLIAHNRPGLISVAIACGLALNAVLLLALYKPMGIAGAAWSLVGNYALSTAILMAMFSRTSSTKFSHCFIFQRGDLMELINIGRRIAELRRR
jgi:O-antigen/teichoic acid export membrane protein